MSSRFFQSLESRSLFSASIATPVLTPDMSASVSRPLHAQAHVVPAPTAKLSAKLVHTALATYAFAVRYQGSSLINASTIGTGNVIVTGPNGYSATPTLVSISPARNSKRITAFYSITPPNGSKFTSNDNGTYTVTLVAGAVLDINGLTNAGSTGIGAFSVHLKVIPAPTAVLAGGSITSAVSSDTFTVTYSDSVKINAGTIATGNVVVSGPNGYSHAASLVSLTKSKNGKSVVATYSIPPSSGIVFSPADNGSYSVMLVAAAVADVHGGTNTNAAGLGTFSVNVPTPSPISATLSASTVTSAAATATFTVTYQDASAINVSSIATGNLTVAGPNGYSKTASLVSETPTSNSTNIVATYSIPPASGGTFSTADNGTYSVNLASGSVTDVNNQSSSAATLGTFAVSISTGKTLPNMLGTYNGATVVPGYSPQHAVQFMVTSENANGFISGNWLTDAGATFAFTGSLSADGTFTYSFQTTNNYHSTGPVTGSGTGTGGGTSTLNFNFSSTSAGYTAQGVMQVTKV